MDADGSFHGHWTGGVDWLTPIDGSVQVSMRGGLAPSTRLLESIAKALPSHWPRRGDTPESPQLDKTRLEQLTASFRTEAGRLHTNDLMVITRDYRITGKGSVGPTGDYDLDGNLLFTREGLSRLLTAASIHGRHTSRSGLPGVPFRVSGNLEDGRYQVHLAQQPLSTLVILPWTVGGVTGTATDALKAAGRTVRGAVPRRKRNGDNGAGKRPPTEGADLEPTRIPQ